jgi:Rab-like protein 5
MSRIKLLVVGPVKAGKSTIANILGDLSDGPSSIYRPTIGCRYLIHYFIILIWIRIVDFEREPPPGVNFGKLHIELWDVSGDFKYEKCWGPIQKDVQGIIFVYDP